MSELLYRFINSDYFSDGPFLSVAYLSRYAGHIGIHHFLCSKLREFSYEEIEFYLPQLCHLLVSIENMESVALEEFIFELCEQSAHGALLTFWLFQTHLHDLSGNPQSNAFKVCRRIYNKVQHIVFGGGETRRRERLKENVMPVTLLSSLIIGSIAAPFLPKFAGPLAIAQARKPQIPNNSISEVPQRLSRSKTVSSGQPSRPRKERPTSFHASNLASQVPTTSTRSKSPLIPQATTPTPTKTKDHKRSFSLSRKGSVKPGALEVPELTSSSTSLPDLRLNRTPSLGLSMPGPNNHRRPRKERPLTPALLSTSKKIHMLRANYFRNETQFLSALEDISNRLVLVPKPARLSALRAELVLLNNDLPSEVDIPMLCPATIHQDTHKTSHHRIVRINPAEATVLNSAERVPYLLMVEILRDDFDFDPEKPENETLLASLLSEEDGGRRRIFDLSEAPRTPFRGGFNTENGTDSVFEPSKGDIGTSPILNDAFDFDITPRASSSDPAEVQTPVTSHLPRLSSGATTLSTLSSIGTPRSSELSLSRSGSPGPKKAPYSPTTRGEAPDLSALATHMRTAAHMLAQLDASSSKRPKNEVAAIKAKIIASMQNLEEQTFFFDESASLPTFDSIMASAATASSAPSLSTDAGSEENDQPNINSEAGAARMENDQKTSGVERKADRDDPSAATFGEEWTAKRERIRKSSPYGWCKNWDLLSVIVKTGADLRQEAFACQLIQVCGKIWEKAGVPVWIKTMRILVTGESSGLIETITNGTSLHSLKRSLTIASIASGKNPRGRIASLKDHFVKTFGEPETETYKAAVDSFARSLAAYSIICYILQLKDRHNGNVLIDNQGHIIHIDFGFMLSNSPGSVGFESAPFKLTQEYVDVLGGVGSPGFNQFRKLCKQAFQALRKSAEKLILLVELTGKESRMPCFASGVTYAVSALRLRFQLQLSEAEAEAFVDDVLIQKSLGSYFTRMYDQFQYLSQGIY
ncbi:Phosphatidylinositol 4-kinase pik1alpha (PI4-kinase)(PtdIns-4-kinase) [Rhizina undulata]